MSRVGKQPVVVPNGVKVEVSGQKVKIEGPKGVLKRTFHSLVEISKKDEKILIVSPREINQKARGLWGLSRSLLNNMVHGVSNGFTKVLEINGVGYKAEINGKNLKLFLGFSNPIEYVLPDGISVSVEKNTILTFTGIDKALLGQVCATVRSFRPPEPYKGKGIKYAEEIIRRKAGKAGIK